MLRFSAFSLVILASWAGCGLPPPPFTPKDDPQATSVVQGRALLRDDSPVPDIVAHLVGAEDAPVQSTRTDSQGRFVFSAAPVGAHRIVLNDGNGWGALWPVTIYSGGTNDVGDVRLGLLEDLPEILAMRGVGYEERLTRSSGNYVWPVYSSDRSFAVAARKKDGEALYDLVRIDTSSGAETVLVAQEDLASWAPTDYYRLPGTSDNRLRLAGDRVLLYDSARYLAPNSPGRPANIAYDLSTGRQLYVSPSQKHAMGGFVTGGALYLLESVETHGYNVGVMVYQSSYRVVRVDLGTGSASYGETLNMGEVDGFPVFSHDSRRLVLVPRAGCYTSPGCAPPIQTGFHSVDLATLLDTQMPVRGNGPNEAVLSSDGAWLYAVVNRGASCSSLNRVNLATGAETQLYTSTHNCSNTQGSLTSLAVSADGSKVAALSWAGPGTQSEIVLVDTSTSTQLPVSLQHSAQGASFALCAVASSGPRCRSSFSPSGDLRISEVLKNGSGPKAAIVDLPVAGPARARLFALGATDDVPVLLASPTRTQEAVLLRDSNGFRQIFSGAVASDPQPNRALTFLSSQHSNAVYSADGRYFLYFARDPVSGFVQFFRKQNN